MESNESLYHLSVDNLTTKQPSIYHSVDFSRDLIVFGTGKLTGALFIYRRNPYTFFKAVPGNVIKGPITLIKISNDQQTIAYANAHGELGLYSLKNLISKSSRIKLNGTNCSALFWHYTDKELYIGDEMGSVSVVSLSFLLGRNLMNLMQIYPILILDTKIVQIDGFNDFLVVSSLTKTILCNNDREEFKQIGNRPRDGNFGACFTIDFESLEFQQNQIAAIDEAGYEALLLNNVTIYCSRPGSRLWQVDLNGIVKTTQQFKNANLSNEKITLLPIDGHLENSTDFVDKANQFQHVMALCNTFVITWNSCGFYIIDPTKSKILFWTNEFQGSLVALKAVDSSILIYLKDGRLLELKFLKLQSFVLHLCDNESFSEAAKILQNNRQYFLDLLRSSSPAPFRSFFKIRDHLVSNESTDMLKSLAEIFDEIASAKSHNVRILSKNALNKKEKQDDTKEKREINVYQTPPVQDEDDTQKINLAVRQTYILQRNYSLVNNLNFRERLCKIFDQFKSSTIIKILSELEILFIDNGDYDRSEAKKVVCRLFLDYLQPEIIFEIDDEKTLSFISDALLEVQNQQSQVSRCQRCEFPLNCGSNRGGYEEIGNILQQFYWSRGEFEKCFELCRALPYLLKITGKFMTDEKKFEKMIPYAINLGDLEILHKSLENFNDISLFHQLLDDYLEACNGKFKCLKCDLLNDVHEGHQGRILTWDCLFQAIEYYICGEELIELLMRFSQFIPNGALSRQFYMKLLLHAND